MEKENRKMIEDDRQKERIRMSYGYALRTYLQMIKKYKRIKFRIIEDEVKKYFHLLDNHFLDKNGKINWDDIRLLMPPNIEINIKNEYSMLNENEVKLCCLLLFDVLMNDITNILPFTKKSIYVIKNRIKKKTGIG